MPQAKLLLRILGRVVEEAIVELDRAAGGPSAPAGTAASPRPAPPVQRPTRRDTAPPPWSDPAMEAASGGGAYPFAAMSAAYGALAIALIRPYPPHRVPAGRSHIGGVPDLPAATPWPRSPTGEAMHFLAQVDCAELPRLAGAPSRGLPERGMLLFFVRMDDELIFADEPAGDRFRVIYDPDSVGRPTPPPADLPGVDRQWQKLFALRGEAARSSFASWPITPVAIQSTPAADAFRGDWAWLADYRRGVAALRAREVERTTGLRPAPDAPWPDLGILEPSLPRTPGKLKPIGETGFPWVAAGIGLVARSVLVALREAGADRFMAALDRWRLAAEVRPAATPVPPDEAAAFAALLDEVMAETVVTYVDKDGVTQARPDARVRTAVWVGAYRLVTESGGDAALARALPARLYDAAYPQHAPVTFNAVRPDDWGYQKVRFAQMLGYVSSTQEALPIDSPLLTLLQLRTDPGLDLIIGEYGEFAFRMPPRDLAERNWDAVTLSHVGD